MSLSKQAGAFTLACNYYLKKCLIIVLIKSINDVAGTAHAPIATYLAIKILVSSFFFFILANNTQ
ncbi:hypothetical protein ABC399_05255 [Lactiplantibacillus plantarum]|uniref:hypothetical protein n=1 Tax=Lactiplantibacillus plantarum TaxID=1590 RepID=UPI0039658EEA